MRKTRWRYEAVAQRLKELSCTPVDETGMSGAQWATPWGEVFWVSKEPVEPEDLEQMLDWIKRRANERRR